MSGSDSDSSNPELGNKRTTLKRQRHELKVLSDTQKRELAKVRDKAEKKQLAGKHAEQTESLVKKHREELLSATNEADSVGYGGNTLSAESNNDEEELAAQSTSDASVSAAKAKHEKRQEIRRKQHEKRLQQQIERREALEEQRRNQGPDLRTKEWEDIEKRLAEFGLEIRKVDGDGHCMYRALEHQLKLKPRVDSSKRDITYMGLRQIAAETLREKRESFEPFLDEEYEAYCDKVQGTPHWGGEIELLALAEGLRRPIHVHRGLDVQDVKYGEEFDLDSTLHIAFHNHYLAAGPHYNTTNPVAKS